MFSQIQSAGVGRSNCKFMLSMISRLIDYFGERR